MLRQTRGPARTRPENKGKGKKGRQPFPCYQHCIAWALQLIDFLQDSSLVCHLLLNARPRGRVPAFARRIVMTLAASWPHLQTRAARLCWVMQTSRSSRGAQGQQAKHLEKLYVCPRLPALPARRLADVPQSVSGIGERVALSPHGVLRGHRAQVGGPDEVLLPHLAIDAQRRVLGGRKAGAVSDRIRGRPDEQVWIDRVHLNRR